MNFKNKCPNDLKPLTASAVGGSIPGYEDLYLYCTKLCAQQHYERFFKRLTRLEEYQLLYEA